MSPSNTLTANQSHHKNAQLRPTLLEFSSPSWTAVQNIHLGLLCLCSLTRGFYPPILGLNPGGDADKIWAKTGLQASVTRRLFWLHSPVNRSGNKHRHTLSTSMWAERGRIV
ncbi:unnamed protein product [Protopolystoma xenopodis]|uniref:Uncharacterized protein n=1 Tax=Protopolystoma xenopodis TaxID=117903 RepID=A0A3S5BJT3_9PLAT|nr:unnamed protein product [Protopolystoma xenopodis]